MSRKHLTDQYGRQINTLRISLTDRCNFRCVYCMPPEGLPVIDKNRFLTIDEIERFVRIVGQLGVSRFRLTGGEPLLRADVVDIVSALRSVGTVRELSMTSNASLLGKLARPLRKAGLDRINVSLDSLDPARFNEVTRTSQYERVRDGIETAIEEGFPVKLNVVVMKGMPDSEIIEFVELASRRSLEVRFLEFMPLCGSGWQGDRVYPIADVRDVVRQRFELKELPRSYEPAQTFAINGNGGRVGFIAPLSEPFCAACSRIRISAEGALKPCLFSNYEVQLGHLLKAGESDETLIKAIRHGVWNKPWGSEFASKPFREGEVAIRRSIASPNIRSIGG